MTIRLIKESDLEQVAELFQNLVNYLRENSHDPYFEFPLPPKEEFIPVLENSIGNPDRPLFVADIGEEIIGFISGDIRTPFIPLAPIPQIGYIDGAYVLPAWRKKGVLHRLDEALIDTFQFLGIEYVELNVMSGNITGKEAWEKLGYCTFREQMRKKI